MIIHNTVVMRWIASPASGMQHYTQQQKMAITPAGFLKHNRIEMLIEKEKEELPGIERGPSRIEQGARWIREL